MYKTNDISLMEPLMPDLNSSQGQRLMDLSFMLAKKNSRLGNGFSDILLHECAKLVRGMNCYYSNLIEGNRTMPLGIDNVLKNKFDENTKNRELQILAKSHIDSQIQAHEKVKLWQGENLDFKDIQAKILNPEFMQEIHQNFMAQLTATFLEIKDAVQNKIIKVNAGQFRQDLVQVGALIAVESAVIPQFLNRIHEFYGAQPLSHQYITIAASHHRLAWIHPFLDGNGRVIRILSDCLFLNTGSQFLWSVSRGLARNHEDYKKFLRKADEQRISDLDGRGNLSMQYLGDFCEFFLKIALEQCEFMQDLFNFNVLENRVIDVLSLDIQKNKLHKHALVIYKEILRKGSIARGQVKEIANCSARTSSEIIKSLLENELATSNSGYGDLRINFPYKYYGSFFPKLYPNEDL